MSADTIMVLWTGISEMKGTNMNYSLEGIEPGYDLTFLYALRKQNFGVRFPRVDYASC